MGMNLNPGNGLFQMSLNSEIYVDKSGLVSQMNRVIGTQQRFVCVSRPRRFGKSMAADMLCAYYDRTVDSRAQFEHLAVAADPTFEKHLNKYDVAHLNIQNFLHDSDGVDDMLEYIEESLCEELSQLYPDLVPLRRKNLNRALASVYAATGIQFVFVLDEWDCVFRIRRDDKEAQTRYLDWLRNLLKDRIYVALAYMTGILPIKKYGQHSALNMFTEISMTNAWPLVEQTGFTEAEVEALCERYGRPVAEMRRWYDGYRVNGVPLYNPRSVVMSAMSGVFDNYWTQTETFEALRVYIDMNMDGLRDAIVRLVAGEPVPVDTTTFVNDMVTFAGRDDVLTLLVHLGYLTYDSQSKCVSVPNYEVMEQFRSTLSLGGWEEVAASIRRSEDLMSATLSGDAQVVAQLVERAHQENSSILRYNDENSLACTVSLAYYSARRTHVIHREVPAGKGFADLVFAPRPGVSAPALVVELKRDAAPEAAIAQIRARGYADVLGGAAVDALLVGIAYDSQTKAHACRIERA